MDNNTKMFDLMEKIYLELQETKNEIIGIKEELNEVKKEQINIQKELKEFRKETSENFNNLSDKLNNLEGTNADNHIAIKGDIKNLQETVEEIEVDLKMVKKITVVNSEDIEKLTVVK